MAEKTKRILQIIAAEQGISPKEVEHEMLEAIRAGMASPNPHAQALWKQICPDGKEPDMEAFLAFMAQRVYMAMDIKKEDKHSRS